MAENFTFNIGSGNLFEHPREEFIKFLNRGEQLGYSVREVINIWNDKFATKPDYYVFMTRSLKAEIKENNWQFGNLSEKEKSK